MKTNIVCSRLGHLLNGPQLPQIYTYNLCIQCHFSFDFVSHANRVNFFELSLSNAWEMQMDGRVESVCEWITRWIFYSRISLFSFIVGHVRAYNNNSSINKKCNFVSSRLELFCAVLREKKSTTTTMANSTTTASAWLCRHSVLFELALAANQHDNVEVEAKKKRKLFIRSLFILLFLSLS